MCFSAPASFTTAALLAIIGALALRRVKDQKQIFLALIPAFFAFQQTGEGILWLSLQGGHWAWLQVYATYLYLIFAQVVWPTWIPMSVWFLERNKTVKNFISFFIIFGALISTYLAVMLALRTVTPTIIGNNIVYGSPFHDSSNWRFVIYAIPIMVPCLISTVRYLWLFGLSIAASLLISYVFWQHALGSVWCFFVALLSGMVLFLMRSMKKL